MDDLALVMIVKNEEHIIHRSLKSVFSFIKKIIIVDTGSTDNTKNIIKKLCKENKKELTLFDS
jgi:glycosyltransferase involved in cell wall biosynthesis